jgi:hypothetical protein
MIKRPLVLRYQDQMDMYEPNYAHIDDTEPMPVTPGSVELNPVLPKSLSGLVFSENDRASWCHSDSYPSHDDQTR